MAGHPIDMECSVKYGLLGQPCSEEEVVDAPAAPQAGGDPAGEQPGVDDKSQLAPRSSEEDSKRDNRPTSG